MQSVVRAPPIRRLILGLAIGPAVAALVFATVSALFGGLPSLLVRIWQTFVTTLWGVHPVTLVFVLPLYLLLQDLLRPSLLNCALAGAAVSAFPWLVLGLLGKPEEPSIGSIVTVHNHMRTLAGWGERLHIVGGMAILGVIAGTLFWARAVIGPRRPPPIWRCDPAARCDRACELSIQ